MTIRSRALSTLFPLLLLLPAVTFAEAPAPAPGKQVEQQFSSGTLSVGYLLFLPKDYSPDGKPSPLMLFLHGAGERGSGNLELVKKHGPPKIVEKKPGFRFIVVSPQCPKGQRFDTRLLSALLDEITKKYHVDRKRVYVTGLSMGGSGTWALANAEPGRFAAIVPICGLAPIEPKRFRSLSTWVVVGGKDRPQLVESLKQTVERLKKTKAPVRFTLHPELGHDSWTVTYNDPKLYKWLLEQTNRGPLPRRD